MRENYGLVVDWDRVGQADFDRIVEALLYREYPGITAINGRGGDQGRDLIHDHDGILTIYQLKYFPGGFPADNRSRRRQIVGSFRAAMAHKPNHWTLVVPDNLTDGERSFVHDLKVPTHQLTTPAEAVGRKELDALCIKFPDVAEYFTRNQLEHVLKLANRASASIAEPFTDLPKGIHALANLADMATGPDWGLNFARQGNKVLLEVFPKHAASSQVSPITIKAFVNPVQLSAETRAALDYGLNRQIVLPALAVQVRGPKELEFDRPNVELLLEPGRSAIDPGTQFEFRFPDGSSYCSEVSYAGAGRRGYNISSKIGKVAKFELLMPFDDESDGNFDITVMLASANPAEAVQIYDLWFALADASRVDFFLDGRRLATARWTGGIKKNDRVEMKIQRELAEDLRIVQEHSKQYFPVPHELTGVERALYRAVRLLLQGKRTTIPLWRELTGVMTDGVDETTRQLLVTGRGAIRAALSQDFIEIGSRRFTVGPLVAMHPDVDIVDAGDALTLVDKGAAAGHPVKMRARYGQDFSAYRGTLDDEVTPSLQRWDLPGLCERGLPEVKH